MERFNFGPAREGEDIVFGAARPARDSSVSTEAIHEWLEFMRSQRIERVVCLQPEPRAMVDAYRDAFDADRVLHEPVVDFTLPNPGQLQTILAFPASRG
jgi:hypothetical protein